MLDERKIKEIIENNLYVDKKDNDLFGFEIFCDYDECLSDDELSEISKAEDPRMKFDEIMNDRLEYATDYYYPELHKTISSQLGTYDDDELIEWINEHCYWYMPENHFNKDINVVVALDVGDKNYDFTKCNILNWYGNDDAELEECSPIYWLANQQDKLTEVQKLINLNKDESIEQYDDTEFSKFANSVINELYNATSHMNTLIFCVKMPLFDFFKLKELIKADEKANSDYDYKKRTGVNNFTITKNAMCGLYDYWQGGGSILEIELEKDVVTPTKAIFDTWIDCRGCNANGKGYDVSDVYGLSSAAFTGNIIFEKG